MNISLKNKIMFAVHGLYLLRQLGKPLVSGSLVLLALVWALLSFVSVPDVWSNMLSSESFIGYLAMAFSETTIIVQTILVAGLLLVVFLLRNVMANTLTKAPRSA